MLALQPSQFADSGYVENYYEIEKVVERLPYAMTNQGLQLNVLTEPARLKGGYSQQFLLDLNCYERAPATYANSLDPRCFKESRRPIQIVLWKAASSSQQWLRSGCLSQDDSGLRLRIEARHSLEVYDPSNADGKLPLALYIRQPGL
jgi:hypothetical protein